MKKILSIALSILVLVSCQQETEIWQENNTGFLMLTSVKAEVEQVNIGRTRAVDASFIVEILRKDGSLVKTFQPGELTQQKIQLEVGSYLLKAYTPNHQQTWGNNEKGEPQYYLEQDFGITAGQVNVIAAQVPMKNCAVTLRLPAAFDTWFTQYTFTITQGEKGQERNVNLKHGETAYFSSEITLGYSLAARNQDDEPFQTIGVISTPAANTEYELTYSLETASLKQIGSLP